MATGLGLPIVPAHWISLRGRSRVDLIFARIRTIRTVRINSRRVSSQRDFRSRGDAAARVDGDLPDRPFPQIRFRSLPTDLPTYLRGWHCLAKGRDGSRTPVRPGGIPREVGRNISSLASTEYRHDNIPARCLHVMRVIQRRGYREYDNF